MARRSHRRKRSSRRRSSRRRSRRSSRRRSSRRRSRRSRLFGKGKKDTGKGVEMFSKEQLRRDLEIGILGAFCQTIIAQEEFDASLIPKIVSNIITTVVQDTAFIYIFNKMFGSHRNWDWYMKVSKYVTRVLAPSLFVLSKTDKGQEYITRLKRSAGGDRNAFDSFQLF
jgi:hypothetical protein